LSSYFFNISFISLTSMVYQSAMYGDAGDSELLDRLDFKKAKLIISTIPTKSDNLLLIEKAKKSNKKIIIYVTANQIEEALSLYDAGADYVILPHFLGGEHASLLIGKLNNVAKIVSNKIKHIRELKHREFLGHEHPPHYHGI